MQWSIVSAYMCLLQKVLVLSLELINLFVQELGHLLQIRLKIEDGLLCCLTHGALLLKLNVCLLTTGGGGGLQLIQLSTQSLTRGLHSEQNRTEQ